MARLQRGRLGDRSGRGAAGAEPAEAERAAEHPVDPAAHLALVVPPEAAGARLDVALAEHARPTRTRSAWQRLVEAGAVTVNGRPARPGQRVAAGDRLEARVPPTEPTLVPQAEVPFRVVYEDPAMVVLDKPAGVVVHPAPGHSSGTLVHGLLARYPELRRPDGVDERPGIVHRLDRDTSGLMVVGRLPEATLALQRQMQARRVEKRYLLLVQGTLREDEGLVDAPLARDPRFRQRMAVRAGGRASQTHFWVRERFGDFTLVEALLLTGRTHQLRVHFDSIGHPVAADATYGSGRAPNGLARQFVHSHHLRLASPHDGLERTFTADLPPDLAAPLEALRRRGPRGL